MPWTAIHEGKEKPPHQVPKRVDVECPTCGGRMRVKSRSSDGKARHFFHPNGSNSGGGGSVECNSVAESDQHMIWKGWAADALLDCFSEKGIEWEAFNENEKREMVTEQELAAPRSEKEWRVGDVVMAFDEPDPQLGDGIIAEVQHKNETKDIDMTTSDYIEQGYSVVWLYSDDFGGDRCLLNETDFRHRAFQTAWPENVPKANTWWETDLNYTAKQEDWRQGFKKGLSKSGAPATLPSEWCDEKALEIWQDQTWDDLFPLYTERRYRLQAAIPKIVKTRTQSVKFSPSLIDEIIYYNSDWTDLFEDTYGHEVQCEKTRPKMRIDFAPLFDNLFWHKAFSSGKKKEWETRQHLDRPPGPFNDVQCHECGHYTNWERAGRECNNCGEPFDWEWNISTGRISAEKVPKSY